MQFPFSFWKNSAAPTLFFVRSHGQTGFSSGTIAVFATVEQFNGTAWSSGTSDTTSAGELPIGDTTFNSLHWVLDGRTAGAGFNPYTASYNRSSWSTYSTRTNTTLACGVSAFSGSIYVAKGATSSNVSTAYTVGTNRLDSFNGTSWTNGVASFSVSAMECGSGNTNSKFRAVCGTNTSGNPITNNETWNGASIGADTAVSVGQSIAVAQTDVNSNFLLSGYNGGINETFNGTAWTSISAPSYTVSSSNITGAGCANGFNGNSGKSYINGGNSNSSTSLTSASSWNGSAWSSVTASSEARAGCAGSVLA